MAHALLDPDYLEQIRSLVEQELRESDGIGYLQLRVGDVIRHGGQDQQIVEHGGPAGWLVVMDAEDHCTVLHDVSGERFHRVEGYA